VPKQSSETEMPVRPRCLYFIAQFQHTMMALASQPRPRYEAPWKIKY
jgi:hypothetical protein